MEKASHAERATVWLAVVFPRGAGRRSFEPARLFVLKLRNGFSSRQLVPLVPGRETPQGPVRVRVFEASRPPLLIRTCAATSPWTNDRAISGGGPRHAACSVASQDDDTPPLARRPGCPPRRRCLHRWAVSPHF